MFPDLFTIRLADKLNLSEKNLIPARNALPTTPARLRGRF